jgi:hypothetical protein
MMKSWMWDDIPAHVLDHPLRTMLRSFSLSNYCYSYREPWLPDQDFVEESCKGNMWTNFVCVVVLQWLVAVDCLK